MQRLSYRAELMSGIKLTVAVLEVMYSAVSVFASETYLVSEVMLIAPCICTTSPKMPSRIIRRRAISLRS